MKKRLISGLIAAAVMAAPMTAYAVNPITESTDQTGEATISAQIESTYTVTIPASVTVPFGANETHFGNIELTAAQLELNKVISVTVSSEGTLKNADDANEIIPYTLTSEGNTVTDADPFVFDTVGDTADLDINILTDDWNKAHAGSYSDVVTFEVEYTDAPQV